MLVGRVVDPSLMLITLDGVLSFVVVIVVVGIPGAAVVAVVVIDEVVASVITSLLETNNVVVVWDTLSAFSFTCPEASVVSVVGLAVDDVISRN